MPSYRVVDADGHVEEPDSMWLEYLDPRYHPLAPRRVTDTHGRTRRLQGGYMLPHLNTAPDRERRRRTGGHDPAARLQDMDSEGVDVAVLYPSLGLPLAGLDRLDAVVALIQAYNNWLRDYCNAAPDRLLGVAFVPQMDIYEAMAETKRGVEDLGFRAVALRPNPIAGRTLDHPAFGPLWEQLVSYDIPLTVHEGTTLNIPKQAGTDRYDNYLFVHAISHPHEQQMACLSLLCGGVLEQHPELRVAFLESGAGWIAYWLERLDHHVEVYGHALMPLSLKPSEYFARQCCISADPDEAILPGIVDVIGDDNIVFASDYPHGDAIFPGAVTALSERHDLSEESKAKILGENANRLYNLN